MRISLPAETFDDATTVRSYKSLALVERAFRWIKTVDLQSLIRSHASICPACVCARA